MQQFIRKVLRIYEGEGTKVFQFTLLASLLHCGLTIGITTADSLFLTHVGADKLPVIYLATPLMMLVYIPIFTYLMNRFGIDWLFDTTLSFLVLGGLLCFYAISSDLPFFRSEFNIVFYAIKLYAGLWYIALYTLMWNFIDCYFDILDAKRLFSIVSGGMSCGVIAGGGMVTFLITILPVEQLFLVWAIIALITFPVVILIRRTWEKIGKEEAETENQKTTFLEQVSTIFSVIRTSPYSNFMILAFLCTLIVTTICEFQYMKVFEEGRTASQIAALFGRLYLIVNCFNMTINLFVFNRLVAVIGVRNTALVQPIVYAVTFSYFLIDYGFSAAVAGFFAYQGILTSVEYNNQNFLFNALPSRDKTDVRTFIEGLCEPLAIASAGLFLMLFASGLSPQSISLIGIAAAGFALCFVMGMRSYYLRAMVIKLKNAWLDFSSLPYQRITGLDDDEMRILKQIADSSDRDRALDAIRILWMNDRITALRSLLAFIDKNPAEDQRVAAPIFSTMLDAEDSEVLKAVLIWLEDASSRIDAALLDECSSHNLLSTEGIYSLSKERELDKRAAAAMGLWRSWKPESNLEAMSIISKLIGGTEKERLAAIRIIGKSDQPHYGHFLAHYMKDPSQNVREQALTSISRLVNEESGRLQDVALEAIRSGNHAMRLTGFDILSKIKAPECVKPLIMLNSYLTPVELRQANAVISSIGLQSVPILATILRDPSCPFNYKSIAARALGNLAFPQFEALAPALIEEQIKCAYDFLCSHWILLKDSKKHASVDFMSRYYKDIQRSVVDFVLELLTISGRLPEFELIATGLRSNNPKERGNAIETIEQGCNRKTFQILLPLVLSRPLKYKIDFYLKTLGTRIPSLKKIILNALESPMQLECAGAVQVAWHLSKKHHALFERDSVHELFQARLLHASTDLVKEVIFSLLSRSHTLRSASRFNTLEKIYWLSRTKFFSSFEIPELEYIAKKVKQSVWKNGDYIYRRNEICSNVYIVVDGAVQIERGQDEPVMVEKLEIFGSEALKGKSGYCTDTISRGATLFSIPKEIVMESAQVYPRIAIGLFAYKLGVI